MSFTYTCEHLDDGMTYERPSTFLNPHVEASAIEYTLDPRIEQFHRSLPFANETKLQELPGIAKELGLARVLLKDESDRFGLPSFKAAGASWAVYRALCQRLGLSTDTSIDVLRTRLRKQTDIELVTCTAGNWGRAVSKMAKLLGVHATVYVPGFTPEYTQNLIWNEGGDVKSVPDASMDDVIDIAATHARKTGGVLVVDFNVEGCGDCPEWVSDGYHTILQETDRQVALATNGQAPGLVSCSVGDGSWAQAVVSHYKTRSHRAITVSVEPVMAASAKEALHMDGIVATRTHNTIMNGMNCGTVSAFSWPVIRAGVDIATVVTDLESHRCVLELEEAGINSGPCGAANLAALRRVCSDIELQQRRDLIVVLFSSEGNREYEIPQLATPRATS